MIDLVFPVFCLGCGAESVFVCDKCKCKIARLEQQKCISCSKPSPFGKTHPECSSKNKIDGIISSVPYNDKMAKAMIEAFKFQSIKSMALTMAEMMADEIQSQGVKDYFSNFTVIPVPLHFWRKQERGYNQAEILANLLSHKINALILPELVKKIRNTKQQAKLKAEQRKNNLKLAFKLQSPSPEKALIVDDVATTGSTLNEIAKLLKRAGAKEVWALTFARD
jgi:competence protein ComFC